jgi:hypothetical protein
MGGTVNPKTGEIEWDFHVPFDEQRTYYAAHPPSALTALKATPIHVDFTFDGHGEPVNAVFALACPCGHDRFMVVCWIEDSEVRPPISIECAACEAEHVIYDPTRHGYDAVAGGLPADPLDGDVWQDEIWPEGIDVPHQVLVRFEQPSDHLGGDPDWKGREQDLFSWITILARDPETGTLAFLFDDECA